MLPSDFTLVHGIAIGLVLLSWLAYSWILSLLGHGTLNSQLAVVRRHWVMAMTRREAKPFDAVLFGHIVHSVAFFGSATLIVLAGVITVFTRLGDLHKTLSNLHFLSHSSIELFALQFGFFTVVLIVCFFSFTYSLRKLVYAIALVGALPEHSRNVPTHDALVGHATTVLSEALKTFNFGIRGYYYAVASLFLFVSPYVSILVTLFVTVTLIYRQVATSTSRAIVGYVDAAKSIDLDSDGR